MPRLSSAQFVRLVGADRALAAGVVPPKRKHKFGVSSGPAERTVDGVVFDSKAEAAFYAWLKTIVDPKILALQVQFELQPGREVVDPLKGRYKQRAINYVADFVVGDVTQLPKVVRPGFDATKFLVMDLKGFRTPDFVLKKKLFQDVFRTPLVEVRKESRNADLISVITNHVSQHQ